MEEMECFEQMQKQVLTSRIQDKNLFEEQALFQDILLVNEIDVYRSLSRKVKFAYTFALQQLPTAKWLVKIDDDFFVRIREFEEFITKTFNDTVPTLISGLIAESKPATSGKWKEVPQYPSSKRYPPFPLGSYGHVVSRPIVEYVAKHQDALFDYQGEDTSLGIWLSQLNEPAIRIEKTEKMKNHGNCLDHNVLIVGHDITPQMMIECNKTTRS